MATKTKASKIKEILIVSPNDSYKGKKANLPKEWDFFDKCTIDTATHVFTIYEWGPKHYFILKETTTKGSSKKDKPIKITIKLKKSGETKTDPIKVIDEKPKHPGWRPPKFKTEKELSTKIDSYFANITMSVPRTIKPTLEEMITNPDAKEEPVLNNDWKQIVDTQYVQIPSILWLCEYLDIHRDTLIEYSLEKEFSDTIKKAKQRIEKYNSEQLYRKEQVTGIIFNLKNNFWWVDKQEIDNNHSWSLSIWWILSEIQWK